MKNDLLKFITCGSVDDGKSTLIGHMLYDAKLIFWYDDGTCMLDWTDGHYAYALRAADAAIDSETLIRIAESVR